jgi:hypothetical protein
MLSHTNFRLVVDTGDLLRLETSDADDPIYGANQVLLLGTLEQVCYFLCGWTAHAKYVALLNFNEQRAIKKQLEKQSCEKVYHILKTV